MTTDQKATCGDCRYGQPCPLSKELVYCLNGDEDGEIGETMYCDDPACDIHKPKEATDAK